MSDDGPKKNSKDEGDERFRSGSWTPTPSNITIPVIAINEEVIQDDLEDEIPTTKSAPRMSLLPGQEYNDDNASDAMRAIGEIRQKLIRRSRTIEPEDAQETGQTDLKLWRRKLVILIWLNFLMKYRKPFLTFVELIFPIICFAVISSSLTLNNTWMMQFGRDGKTVAEDNPFHPYQTMSQHRILKYVCSNQGYCDDDPDAIPGKRRVERFHYIVYAPNNEFTNKLMAQVQDILDVDVSKNSSRFFGVKTTEFENMLNQQWVKQDEEARYPYGVLFSYGELKRDVKKQIEANQVLPKQLRYTIRTFYPETANTDENFPFVEHSTKQRTRHEVSPYISTGFSGLQLAIDIAFMEMVKIELTTKKNKTLPKYENFNALYGPNVRSPYVHMYKYPVFLDRAVSMKSWVSVVLSIILSYAVTNLAVTQEIATETESGKMELLKLHGLTPALHWISYGINMCVIAVFISLFMAIVIYYSFVENSIIVDEYENLGIIWLFFFLHGVAQYTENLLSVQFFSSPAPAGMFAILKSLAAFLLPMLLIHYSILTRLPNFILCLLIPQWCLANENGLAWYDFPVIIDTEEYVMASIPICCILFLYNITIFLLLTIYFDRVFSKPYAPSITWKYLWKLKKVPKPEFQRPPPPINYKEMPQMYERPPIDLKCTIKVRNLCKTFATEKSYEISLDNISVDIFEGEILAVCGPAGSGKTNLLHLIAGLTNPTSGFVEMKNLKVHEYSDILNHYISIVPQKTMLFPTLSVEDHVRLCCMVHGNSYKKSKQQAKKLLQLFSLQGARRHSYLYLSKTQVKKLAFSMALASSPTMLILDEPTQGIDVESSKELWKNLLSLKTKRTVIVATSRLEDVELYCDRMLLLVNGKVVCYGTANRIKKYYDAGSIINIQEGGEAIPNSKIQDIVLTEMKGATKLFPLGFEKGEKTLRFVLPFAEPYAPLLEKIEDHAQDLQYSKMWISRLELGALLFKISNSKMIESTLTGKTDFFEDVESDEALHTRPKINNVPDRLIPEKTAMKQFQALFTKKWLAMTQKNKFWILEYIVPISLMIMMLTISEVFLNHHPESLARELSLQHYYKDSLTLIKPAGENSKAWIDALDASLINSAIQAVDKNVEISQELERRKPHTLTNKRQQAIIAVEKDGDVLTGYYSSNSYHSCPISINVLTNTVLTMLTGAGAPENERYSVRVTNHPMQQYEGFPAGSTQNNTIVMFAFIISIILALLSAAEMQLPLWERQNGIKILEKIAGVRPIIYWFTNYCGGFVMNAILGVIIMGLVCIINLFNTHHQFTGQQEKFVFAMIIFGYLCWSSIPYSYFLSGVLNPSHEGYTHFMMVHFSIGILPMAFTFQILRTKITGFNLLLRYFCHLSPPYSLTSALVHYFHTLMDISYCNTMDQDMCTEYGNLIKIDPASKSAKRMHNKLYNDPVLQHCCDAFCSQDGICHKRKHFFVQTQLPGLWADFIAIACQGVLFWIIVMLMENHIPHKICFKIKTTFVGDKEIKATVEDTRDTEEPDDVKKEHQRVDYMIDVEDDVESQVILVQDVSKFYKSTKCIDHVYFSIPVRSNTGILGLAKSGMSTLIKLLTGEYRVSAGNIYMDNEHVTSRNRRQCLMKIGYCPQKPAYYADLTGFQMLKLFAQLRGVPESQLDVQVKRWLTILDLETVARMSCKGYRPGVLRRLCCAIAMIGSTRVVILDCPTDDMDLREREIFWKAVNEAKKKGQTTFFTSTSTEEVRYCTDKAMIISHGGILSVGTPRAVFKENQRGFMLSIKLRSIAFRDLSPYQVREKIDQLKDHIISYLSPCELLVDEGKTLIYHLKDLTIKLSRSYGVVEGAREIFPILIDNFLIAESSLDDVIFHLNRKARMRLSNAAAEDFDDDGYRSGRPSGGSI